MIGVLGGNGFVGSAICRKLKNEKIKYKKITRDNYIKFQSVNFTVLINSAMPSKRFWAKKNPLLDYIETVEKTKYFVKKFKFKKFVHISSISARCQSYTVYGKNKKKSENIVKKLKNFLIIRLGPMFGRGLDKGVLIDLRESKKVYVNKFSKYSFTNIDCIANYIVNECRFLKKKNAVIEYGATDSIILNDLKKIIKSDSIFKGEIDNQLIKNSRLKNMNKSHDVIKFLKDALS